MKYGNFSVISTLVAQRHMYVTPPLHKINIYKDEHLP